LDVNALAVAAFSVVDLTCPAVTACCGFCALNVKNTDKNDDLLMQIVDTNSALEQSFELHKLN